FFSSLHINSQIHAAGSHADVRSKVQAERTHCTSRSVAISMGNFCHIACFAGCNFPRLLRCGPIRRRGKREGLALRLVATSNPSLPRGGSSELRELLFRELTGGAVRIRLCRVFEGLPC